jgi:peptide/nickel transport system substrate-binding protein
MHVPNRVRRVDARVSRLLAVTATAAVTLTALATAGAATPLAKPKPRRGGTVITALNLEPPSLNWYLGAGAPFSTSIVSDQILASAYHDVGKEGRLVPDLLVRDPEITKAPFSLTYTIKKQARWSDGAPITARDFVFTWQVLANAKFDLLDGIRKLYEPIVRAKILGAKRVRFVFRKPVPEWKSLFGPVLPQHALAGEEFDKVWRDRIDNPKTGRPISSGPFIFESWNRGSRLTLARNGKYWADKPHLDHLAFRFILPDFGAQIRALRAGEVDLIQAAGASIGDLRSSPGITVRAGSSTFWEHIDFQLGPKGHPALRKLFVRQAIAYAIDRKSLTRALYKEIAPGLKTDQSAVYLPFQRAYRPHWLVWRYSPQKAVRLLRSHGCRRGGDGIFSCQGRRLSFRLLSTAGNSGGVRERTFELVQPQLKRIGIDLVKDFGPSHLVLDTLLPQGDWDLALFAWSGGEDFGWDGIFGCNGSINNTGYCNGKVTTLLRRASAEPKSSLRTPLLNRADALMARDLPTLPLYVRPGYVIYNSRIRNVTWNPIDVLWNAQDWWIAPP